MNPAKDVKNELILIRELQKNGGTAMKSNSGVRLTLKTAKALIHKEFKLTAAQLKTECAGEGVYIYKMPLGRFEITVENDWFERNGLYVLTLSSNMGDSMRIYYDPATLEENCEAGDAHRASIKAEHCEGCTLAQDAREAQT